MRAGKPESMRKIDWYIGNHVDVYKSLETHEFIAPKQVTLELTYRCTAKCVFCARWRVKPEDVKEEMTTDEYRNLIKDLERARTHRIDLTGGEPLIRQDFFDIVDQIKKSKIEIVLSTNGSLLPKFAKEIVEHDIDSVMVSIDSVHPQRHDKIRDSNGIWENAVEGVKLLKEYGVKVSIGAVLTKENLNEVEDYIAFARKLGVGFRFQPVHDDRLNNLMVRDKSILFSKNDLEQLNKATEIIVKNRKLDWIDVIYYKLSPWFLVQPERFLKIKCPVAARTLYFIDPYGNVYPCESRRDLILGNVRKEKFYEIVNSDRAENVRRNVYSDERKCVCWYRCTAPDMILYQFPQIISMPKLGLPTKQMWDRKLRKLKQTKSGSY